MRSRRARFGVPPDDRKAVEAWSVSVSDILATSDLRLDATHFDQDSTEAVEALQESDVSVDQLSELASVELRSQFTRIWAEGPEHGLPYLNATDLLSLFALGVPAGGQRHLSYATETDIDSLIIREGWLLMTCSGTIGRVFYVPARLDGWAATHDLIRIIPNHKYLAGYLYAWLSQPSAQTQILSHTHGGQIDHVTDAQVGTVLVPRLPTDEIKRISRWVIRAIHAREQSTERINSAWESEG